MNKKVENIFRRIKESPFNRSYYSVDCEIKRLASSLLLYIDYDSRNKDELEQYKILLSSVPAFQRDNDKWTRNMQASFVENILMGCNTEIMFYDLSPDNKLDSCKILDGLQRLTAIYEFYCGEFKVWDMTYREMLDNGIIAGFRQTIKLRIYNFHDEAEAVRFYIQMNENITHSADDILRAKKYLKSIERIM